MYLLDTNIFLELLLEQRNANEVEKFLRNTSPEKLYCSEFSLYSVGIILFRPDRHEVLSQFIDDLFINGGVQLISLSTSNLRILAKHAREFNLDFDNAYQYQVANNYDLTLVSFDKDFDRTEAGRVAPNEIVS